MALLLADRTYPVPTKAMNDAQNILFIVRKLPPHTDGVGDYTHQLACAFAARGHKVAILTSTSESSSHPLVRVLPWIRRWDIWELDKIITACRQDPATVVNLQFSPFMYDKRGQCLGLFFWMACVRVFTSARLVATFHELYNRWSFHPVRAAASFVHRLQFFALGALANQLIFTTERRRQLGRRWFSWKKERVHCVPVGSNIEPATTTGRDLEETRRRYRGDARHLICTFGMLQRGIQFEELLQAFAGLVREDRLDAKMLFIGDWTNGELTRRQKLQSLVSALGLTDRVVWSGPQPVETISTLLSISDLYVCYRADGPTTRSGTLAAALAHGLPVVANRCADLDPIFADGRTVMLFDDARGLREGCQRLLTDAPLREQFSQRARSFAASRLAWPKIAESYEQTWRDTNPKSEIRNPKQIRMTEIRNHA